MKNLLLFFTSVITSLFLTAPTFAQTNSGALLGVVVNESSQTIPLCTVVLIKDSQIEAGIITDEEGRFILGNIEPGTYDLKISSVGFSSRYIRGIEVVGNEVSIPPIEMKWGVQMSSVVCSAYRPFCSKPCGYGCICECCVPVVEFREDEPAGYSGALISVDTTSFLALESWRSLK